MPNPITDVAARLAAGRHHFRLSRYAVAAIILGVAALIVVPMAEGVPANEMPGVWAWSISIGCAAGLAFEGLCALARWIRRVGANRHHKRAERYSDLTRH